ncbi:hypothetical protein ONS95_014261 [Cadophora gregata]|uniref:uncharacterized protein n=1 Tax=Cadophora gregata TaxID=51156 RepID=UPI0026DB4D8B|nr:uncharacterized protein ONS95_014261 [Cadophora gregata]KAK0114778.1 hypothetical protein ONS95_014261 [Cadophora gregata]
MGEVIDSYKGKKSLSELSIYPFQYHAERGKVRSHVLDRGRKFISLYGTHHKLYETLSDSDGSKGLDGNQDEDFKKTEHRVILDWKQYHETLGSAPDFVSGTPQMRTRLDEHLNLKDEDYLITHYKIPGYCLTHKQWSRFPIDGLKDIDFNVTAFDSLVLPKIKKDLISSLVKGQEIETSSFDDLIAGKGKGLIFLLHGPPGVEKTLTAESIAEYTKRPLFTISCADLGVAPASVEKSLRASLELATQWHSIVLLDEADVFMEERTRDNLPRNELVSVLLRTLEYFEGIMFLTTNRATSIDPAFKSRIHLSISYPTHSLESRRELWKTFVSKSSATGKLIWLNEKSLNRMAKVPINGRQIKNIVRIAHCRAVNEKREMALEDILLGLQALELFEEEFKKAQEATGTKNLIGWRQVTRWGALAMSGALCSILIVLGIIFGVWKLGEYSRPGFEKVF